jgi:hypothetical protein
MRLDALPAELLRAELKLARADRQAARATLQAAEASLARANVRDVQPLPDATVKEKLERAATDEDGPPDGEQTDQDEPDPGETPGLADAAKDRRGADEQWVRECRLAVERAEQRVRALEAAVAEAGRHEPDEPAHRAFAKRTSEARGAPSTRPGPPTARPSSTSCTPPSWPRWRSTGCWRRGPCRLAGLGARPPGSRRRGRRGRPGLGGAALRRPAHRQGRVRAGPHGRGVARPPLAWGDPARQLLFWSPSGGPYGSILGLPNTPSTGSACSTRPAAFSSTRMV